MTVREYAEGIALMIGGTVTVKEINKPNGIVKYGITKLTDERITPVCYVDNLFNDGVGVIEAASKIKEFLDTKAPTFEIEVGNVTDFEETKSRLRARLYHQTTLAEVYRHATDYGFDDLIIIPYIQFNPEASIKVTSDLLSSWGVSADKVIDIAIENTKADVVYKNMNEILVEIMGEEALSLMPENSALLTVVTNKSKMFGAISIIYLLDTFKEKFPNGFIIIPSSVHEVIVANIKDDVSDMVRSVNASALNPEDVLSDHVYFFKGVGEDVDEYMEILKAINI